MLGGSAKSSSAAARIAALLALLGALAACTPHPASRAPTAPAVLAPGAAATPAGPLYRIDAAHSSLRILVYRAGALARLGHNHVLESHELGGEVRLAAAGQLAGAHFDTSFAVTTLVIDEAAARRAEGADFATQPSAGDIEGTRHNLLGPMVLDAGAFPVVRVHGVTKSGSGGLEADVTIEVHGHSSTLNVSLTAANGDGRLTIRGGFGVAQTALGLTPFSLALGALSVRDAIEVRFEIVAVPAG